MSDPWVVVLGLPLLRDGFLEAARRAGVAVAAVDDRDGRLATLTRHRTVVHDIRDPDAVLSAAGELTDGLPARSVAFITFFDGLLPVAATLNGDHGGRGLSLAAAAACLDKGTMRDRLAQAGVAQPGYARCRTADDAVGAARRFGGRCCIKPADRSGSIGVTLVDDPRDVEPSFRLASEVRARAAADVLVEERVEGRELSVEALTRDGHTTVVCITEKELVDGTHPIEAGHVLPARLDEASMRAASEVAVAAVAALGIDDTVTHTEVMLGDSGARLIEVNGRPAGDLIPEAIAHAVGVDLYTVALRLATGLPIDVDACRPTWQCAAAIRFTFRDVRPGGIEAAARLPGVVTAACAESTIAGVAHQRTGHVVATGATSDDAAAAAARAADAMTGG